MALDDLQRTWEGLGESDPLWAVLSFPERRGGRWDPEEFFATGREEIDALMSRIAALGIDLRRGRCLDFGCGVGRLTQALAHHFERCDGVDIAELMIQRANGYNRFGDRVRYHLNVAGDLRLFDDDSFDLVYTRIVLQHVPPAYTKRYVPEFVRILRPGGLAFFHIPAGPSGPTLESYALPETAYRAAIGIEAMPRVVAAGRTVTCGVRVRNQGGCVWSSAQPHPLGHGWLRIGNHWLDWRGRSAVSDDSRAPLPHDLSPGEDAIVRLRVTAPRRPGAYLLEVDMVHEGLSWFAGHGSPTARRVVAVRPARAAGATTVSEHAPFEMHSVPREEVLALIAGAGGRLVTTEENDEGPFHDVHYVVTKDARQAVAPASS